MLTPEELQYYKREYNLAGQPDFLVEMNRHCSLEGKRVLEVGGSNIPHRKSVLEFRRVLFRSRTPILQAGVQSRGPARFSGGNEPALQPGRQARTRSRRQ